MGSWSDHHGRDTLKKILVVEDDSSLRTVIGLVLENHGYQVAHAAHGGEALERLRADRPDLVLADAHMPVVSGLELADVMRASADLRDIPIGLLSGDLELIHSKHGADFVVIKPFEPAELVSAIETATGNGVA
jgi:CheY-like chemotaxis protein